MTPRGGHWWLPATLAGLCVFAMAPGMFEALRYERALVGAEPWRLVTAHVAHLGWLHLLLNLAGLAATWALLGALLRPGAWLVAIFVCALGVSGGLYVRNPELAWYVGLSGVLHGLFTVGTLAGLGRARLFHGLLLAGILAKVAWEQIMGADTGSAAMIGGAVVVEAHLYGMLAGAACLPLAWRGRPLPTRAPTPRA